MNNQRSFDARVADVGGVEPGDVAAGVGRLVARDGDRRSDCAMDDKPSDSDGFPSMPSDCHLRPCGKDGPWDGAHDIQALRPDSSSVVPAVGRSDLLRASPGDQDSAQKEKPVGNEEREHIDRRGQVQRRSHQYPDRRKNANGNPFTLTETVPEDPADSPTARLQLLVFPEACKCPDRRNRQRASATDAEIVRRRVVRLTVCASP